MTDNDDKSRDAAREQWSGEERRKRRSSFVERIGRARARRKTDPEPPSRDAGERKD